MTTSEEEWENEGGSFSRETGFDRELFKENERQMWAACRKADRIVGGTILTVILIVTGVLLWYFL